MSAVPLRAPSWILRRARRADVDAMARMINGYASAGLMLPRTTGELYRKHREFVVAVDCAGNVMGCGGLRVYGPHLAEIVSLAVREDARSGGIGGTIVDRLVHEAVGKGIGAVFAMTLRDGFFGRKGFDAVPRTRLPEKIARDCRFCPLRSACPEKAVFRKLRASAPMSKRRRPLAVLAC